MYRNEAEKKLESSVRTATHALTRGILGATHKKDGGGGRKALFSRLFCCIFGERETNAQKWPNSDRRPKAKDFFRF